jgi:predicted enzyme related to lactoylglutathione lyase
MSGEPSHFEIGVPDAARARSFFGQLLGWDFEGTQGADAWIRTSPIAGGLHGDDPEAAIELYFTVPDIEAAVRRVRELGGEAGEAGPEGPTGRYAYGCTDDQGVRFGLHQPPAG